MSDSIQSTPPAKRVHAFPTKDFFVNMLTRDISLEDCIFDLLDNSIDGARRISSTTIDKYLDGARVKLSFDQSGFSISDNCGGISLSDAIDYAFHFGRRADSPADVKGGIGLYGIGMKRAIFKIGRKALVHSETASEAFAVDVDVESWMRSENDWDFGYNDTAKTGEVGTKIQIWNLIKEISVSFNDPVFQSDLIRKIARDYAFFLTRGLKIEVCDVQVPQFQYGLRTSENVAPAVDTYVDEGVTVKLAAGLIDEIPDEIPDEIRPREVDRYGWFVVCNDRIVLSADKTQKSIWGNSNFQSWHPQYNGFAGFAFFNADDQRKLPWTTTKRDLDVSNPVYCRAIARMKVLTTAFISYTNSRKAALDEAKEAERQTTFADVYGLSTKQAARLPKFQQKGQLDEPTISYKKPRVQVDEIKRYLGRPGMTLKEIGQHTFEYFRKAELGK